MLLSNDKWFLPALELSAQSRIISKDSAAPVYIATTLSNRSAAEEVGNALLDTRDYWLTYPWYLIGEVPKTASVYARVAHFEMTGVLHAEIFIGLLPGRLGMATELGAAIAAEKEIILYAKSEAEFWEYEGNHPNIFWHHPSVTRVTGDDPVASILNHLQSGERPYSG